MPHCEPLLIAAPFITSEREVRVPVPTVNSLLGDKLTAFAPRTIGILLICKHGWNVVSSPARNLSP